MNEIRESIVSKDTKALALGLGTAIVVLLVLGLGLTHYNKYRLNKKLIVVYEEIATINHKVICDFVNIADVNCSKEIKQKFQEVLTEAQPKIETYRLKIFK